MSVRRMIAVSLVCAALAIAPLANASLHHMPLLMSHTHNYRPPPPMIVKRTRQEKRRDAMRAKCSADPDGNACQKAKHKYNNDYGNPKP